MKNEDKPNGSLAKGFFLGLVFWFIVLITCIFIDLFTNFSDLY